MASAALQSFRRTVTITWPKNAEEGAQKALVRIAKAGHAKIMAEQTARSGHAPDFESYGNFPGRPVEQVELPGPVVYRYKYFKEILNFALQALREASPVRSGLYRDSHTLYINGISVTNAPPNIRSSDEIYIANPVAYARRLEVGLTESGRPFVIQVPPRIYERTRQKLIARFGKVATFQMTYITAPQAYTIQGKLPSHYIAKGGVRRKRRQRVGAAVQSPAILISVKT
jgi:hypothetical protein